MLRSCACSTFLIALLLPVASVAGQSADEWDDAAVAKAIEDCKAFLWSQWSDGHWKETYGQRGSRTDGPSGPNYGGVTSLCLYALLAAGEGPQDAKVKQTLEWLTGFPIHGVYARGFRANVWGEAVGKQGRSSPYFRMLNEDVRWLVNAAYVSIGKYPDGSYPYIGGKGAPGAWGREDRSNWDNSNSQVAVLGVWAGVRNGVEIPPRYWPIVEKHWIKVQKGDGGWDYAKPSRWKIKDPNKGYGAMTAAGLATLFICLDNAHAREFIRCRATTDTAPIVKGLQWMEKNFTPRGNPGRRTTGVDTYYLYGVERVGLASGHKYFGKKDWYKQGARTLIGQIHPGRGLAGSLTDTAFALLFLARGRHPVLLNKLKYEGIWNARPRDLANFTRWISREFETPVNWQIINLDVDVAEWHDAPILYISGASPPKFSDAQLDKLRTYVHQGGVIFSESACNSRTFDKAMRAVYARLFPKHELTPLPDDHEINTQPFKIRRGRRLEAVSNGIRPLAIHSPGEFSLAWQLRQDRAAMDLFRQPFNLYVYVTDRGSLRSRGVTPWPPAKPFTPTATVRLVPVKYAGPWDVEPMALKRFALLMGRRHKVKIELAEPTALTNLDAAKAPVAVMTGISSVSFSAEEIAGLKRYLSAGGTLIADAAGGRKEFAEAMEKLLPTLLPGAAYAKLPPAHPIYTRKGMEIGKVVYRRAMKPVVGDKPLPRLQALTHNGRAAVIFSDTDLTAGLVGYQQWGLRGYAPESAFALMRNAVLHAAGK